jgi:cytochrome P450
MNCFFYLGEQYWKNPDEFNPERFINDQNEIITPEAFIPFGYGNKSSFFMDFK